MGKISIYGSIIFGVLIFVVVTIAVFDAEDVPESTAEPTSAPAGFVRAEDYGDAWPLTVPSGIVDCEDDYAYTFEADGTIYAINGAAELRPYNYLDIRSIWRDNPDTSLVAPPKVSLSPLFLKAEEMC